MLVRNLTLSGSRSVHTVRVSTIYQFVTVFNHSDHAITVFPENLTLDNDKHYRVPPRIYLTLPLIGAGRVESCSREVVYTIVSDGVAISNTVITLSFTEENNGINMPFPDMTEMPIPTDLTIPPFQIPSQHLPIPLPVMLTNSPIPVITNMITKHDLIRGLIPNTGTLALSQALTFSPHTSHVARFSLIINTQRDATLIISERINTGATVGSLFQISSTALVGGSTTRHTGNLYGNNMSISLINGAIGTSTYNIGMLGHTT